MSDYVKCPNCGKSMSDFDYQEHDCIKDLISDRDRLQAEVERLTALAEKYRKECEDAIDILKGVVAAWKYEADQGDGIMEENSKLYDIAITRIQNQDKE